jgi:hypothetical protein
MTLGEAFDVLAVLKHSLSQFRTLLSSTVTVACLWTQSRKRCNGRSAEAAGDESNVVGGGFFFVTVAAFLLVVLAFLVDGDGVTEGNRSLFTLAFLCDEGVLPLMVRYGGNALYNDDDKDGVVMWFVVVLVRVISCVMACYRLLSLVLGCELIPRIAKIYSGYIF